MSGDQTPIWVQLVIPALTAVSAALGAMVVSQYQKAKNAREVSVAKEISNRLKYLDPLRLATENLAWKLFTIEQKIRQKQLGSGGLDWMLNTFHCVKEPEEILHRTPSTKEFAFWCNGEGFFAVSTIYVTAVYFYHARRTRREYVDDKELIQKLDAIRLAFGHEYGIYALLQDSIGEYMCADDKMEIGYRTFCLKMYQEEERLWLLNVLDYFREIDKKTDAQRFAISSAVNDLLSDLGRKTGMIVRLPHE